MLHEKIIRAWKDPEFRMSLSEDELAELPENPAGAIELTDEELELATGGRSASSGSSSSSGSSRSSSSGGSSVACDRNVRWPTVPPGDDSGGNDPGGGSTWRTPHTRPSVKPSGRGSSWSSSGSFPQR